MTDKEQGKLFALIILGLVGGLLIERMLRNEPIWLWLVVLGFISGIGLWNILKIRAFRKEEEDAGRLAKLTNDEPPEPPVQFPPMGS